MYSNTIQKDSLSIKDAVYQKCRTLKVLYLDKLESGDRSTEALHEELALVLDVGFQGVAALFPSAGHLVPDH